MNPQYQMIVSEFCALVQLEDAQRIADEASFEVDGVTFALSCREFRDSDSFLLIADVATLGEDTAHLSRELLSRSLREMVARNACYCISDVTGAVLHLQRFFIQQITPQALVNHLQVTVGVVDEVREVLRATQVDRP